MWQNFKVLILISGIFLISIPTMGQSGQKGQKTSKLLDRADKLFEELAYSEAIPVYESALKESVDQQSASRLAECYRLTANYRKAEVWYAITTRDPHVESEQVLRYAQALQSNWKIDEALAWYQRYESLRPEDDRADLAISDCKELTRLLRDSLLFTVKNLKVNSEGSDFGPSFYNKGIVFSTDRQPGPKVSWVHSWTGRPFLDLFYSEGLDGTNAEANSFSEKLNTRYHEGPAVFSTDFKEVFITRNNFIDGKAKANEEGTILLKILHSVMDDNGHWTKPVELPINSDQFSCAHPALSPDGQFLYFTSDRPGSLGQSDIWVVERTWKGWAEPVNLGPAVNTEGEESFPFVHEDGTLFFASDGRGGLGGLDIYRSTLDSRGKWTRPENLGYPINSRRDDLGLIWSLDYKQGYFSSDRAGGLGSDDIYSVTSGAFQLRGIVYDKYTHEPVGEATVELLDGERFLDGETTDDLGDFKFQASSERKYRITALAEGYRPGEKEVDLRTISGPGVGFVELHLSREGVVPNDLRTAGSVVGQVIDEKTGDGVPGAMVMIRDECAEQELSTRTNQDGYYSFVIEPGCRYKLTVEMRGFVPDDEEVIADADPDPSALVSVMNLRRLEEGMTVEIKNIYYDYDEHYIRADAVPELNRIVRMMRENTAMKIEIGSHTDSRGTEDYNNELSDRRARAVVEWLIREGVSPVRLVARGYGESRVRNNCVNGVPCPEAAHQFNRRTEFTVLHMGQAIYSRDQDYIPVQTGQQAYPPRR